MDVSRRNAHKGSRHVASFADVSPMILVVSHQIAIPNPCPVFWLTLHYSDRRIHSAQGDSRTV